MAFYQGIFPTCIGASNQLPNTKRLVGLVSILVGTGELAATGINLIPAVQRKIREYRMVQLCVASLSYVAAAIISLFMFQSECTMSDTGKDRHF